MGRKNPISTFRLTTSRWAITTFRLTSRWTILKPPLGAHIDAAPVRLTTFRLTSRWTVTPT